MTLKPVLGSLLVFTLCPILGAMPVVKWIGQRFTSPTVRTQARWLERADIAFEALKGAIVVLLARQFFPPQSEWELVAAVALVMGNYWARRRVGTVGAIAAVIAHDPLAAGLVFVIGSISLTVLRERQQGRLGILMLFPAILLLLDGEGSARVGSAIIFSGVLFWLYRQLPSQAEQLDPRALFDFFQPDKALVCFDKLDKPLKVDRVGQNAATLSQLHCWGYPVPKSWVLLPGDDPQLLLDSLIPSQAHPLTLSASPLGGEGQRASSAGQYFSTTGIASREALEAAIAQCLASYDRPSAIEYRRELDLEEDAMAVLVRQQVREVFSGVAFSRDPVERHGDAVVIESLPGELRRAVAPETPPEFYRAIVPPPNAIHSSDNAIAPGMCPPPPLELLGKAGDVPPGLLRQVAWLVRYLEIRFEGIPQSIEWSYDGQRLWVLQCRPIHTLRPMWTRDAVDGWLRPIVHPLSWSIHRPLLVETWERVGSIFLGDCLNDFKFNEIVTLHDSRIYFNQLFLQQIWQTWSLERCSGKERFWQKFALWLKHLPVELNWVKYRVNLWDSFKRDRQKLCTPILEIHNSPEEDLSVAECQDGIRDILEGLKQLYFHSFFLTTSIQVLQNRLGVETSELDRDRLPETRVRSAIQRLAVTARHLLDRTDLATDGKIDSPALFARLSETQEGQQILEDFDRLLDLYGYWNESGVDLAVPTWQENPHEARELFARLVWEPCQPPTSSDRHKWNVEQVQKLINLKARALQIYRQLFAKLRRYFLALEQHWIVREFPIEPGDIFYLTIDEIRAASARDNVALRRLMPQLIASRRVQFHRDRQREFVPDTIYGNPPPMAMWLDRHEDGLATTLQGMGVSPGRAEGRVQVLRGWQSVPQSDRQTIWVIPYLYPSWTHLFARAGGLIVQTGGMLSHGAIVAREYGIPTVVNIDRATSRFRDGQRVQLDGTRGTITILGGS
ncbi:MAG: PEP-utilizing enzyme [Cyanobacteriota bacterium]|nr:PEP-utilizing enzyme [Cyanobacteriota bacterium]